MDDARRMVEQGDDTTIAISADEQTAGRGRQNRPWITFPAPHGLAATFIVRPVAGPHVALVAALALHEALAPHQPSLRIKWPNDLLLDGKKLAGILCENVAQKATLIGIGLNLTAPPHVPPAFAGAFLNPTATLPPVTPQSIWACLNRSLTLYRAQGWSETLHKSYLRHCATIGQSVQWNGAGTQVFGKARGLNPDGHLEIVEDDGTVHVIHSGDIVETRP